MGDEEKGNGKLTNCYLIDPPTRDALPFFNFGLCPAASFFELNLS